MTNAEINTKTILKTKANFENYIQEYNPTIITSTIAGHPNADGRVIVTICDLTQNIDTFLNALAEPTVQNLAQPPLIAWLVTSEKEKIQNLIKIMNKQASSREIQTFVFKATLNDDESDIDIECILKPEIKDRRYIRKDDTPAKLLQQAYWEEYNEQSDKKITPAPRHYQALAIGKGGVQIYQTVNTAEKYVATEILIREDKTIYEKLLEHREEIEKELGGLDWQKLEEKKSSRIRKKTDADITTEEGKMEAVKAHIEMAKEFKRVFSQYL